MANAYTYSFSGTLDVQQGLSSPGNDPFAKISGSFTVDYDSQLRNGTSVPGEIFVNGQRIGGTSIFATSNPNGVITYNIFSYNEDFQSGKNQYVNLFYNGQTPSTFVSATYRYTANDNSVFPPVSSLATYRSQAIDVAVSPVCFITGTRIRTSRGEVAVEALRVGDRAVTASGALRPVTWIGHRTIIAEGSALPFSQQPVRVRAGAFGGGLPVRDLCLSPGHPVLVGADADNEGGVLVPVMCLINGTTITREARPGVTYWHVELDRHDILLAEGLPAESYLDGGDRAFFEEASDHALHDPDFVAPGWAGRCRPVAVEGAMVEAERLRLDAVFAAQLTAQCGWDDHQNGI